MKEEVKQIAIDEAGNKNKFERKYSSNLEIKEKSKGPLSNRSEGSDRNKRIKQTSESESSADEKNVEIDFNENDDTIAIEEQIKETIIHDTSKNNIQIKKEIESPTQKEKLSDKDVSQNERKVNNDNNNEKDKNEGDYYKPKTRNNNESNSSFNNDGGFVMSFLDPRKNYLSPSKMAKFDPKSKLDLKKKDNYVQLDFTTRTDSNNNKVLEIISTQNRGGYDKLHYDSYDQSNLPQINESYQEDKHEDEKNENTKNQKENENVSKKDYYLKKFIEIYSQNKKIVITIGIVISSILLLILLRI